MVSYSFPALLLLVTLNRLTLALPVSPSHRFSVYTPYWAQGARPLPTTERVDCLVNICGTRSDYADYVRTPGKRSKNLYKTGWTMGGMPFSVLYMNPKTQMSARSPMSESLRSLPTAYDNDEPVLAPLMDSRAEPLVPEVQAQALSSRQGQDFPSPTSIPTRRQYSIIPQLFVSYGWGPMGKRDH